MKEPIGMDMPSRPPAEIEELTTTAIARADARIAEALREPDHTFNSLFGALDDAARIVGVAFGQGAFLRTVDPDEAVRAAASEAGDRIEKWKSSLAQRAELAAAVTGFASSPAAAALDADQAGLLRAWERDVRQSGVGLDATARAEVERLQDRLIDVQGAFLANAARAGSLELTLEELDGAPEHLVGTFAPASAPGTLNVPINDGTAIGLLESLRRRDVRERVNREFLNRGMPENLALLEEALSIRRRLAALLGYRSWLDLRAEGFAAEDGAAIGRFISDMAARLGPLAREQTEAMRQVLLREPGAPMNVVVEDWDWRYVEARQRAALGGDPAELRQYLAFDDVLRGFLALSEEVFGIRLVERPERRGWHPDVRAFDLVDRDDGSIRGRMFFDPFVRPGKHGPAFAEVIDPGAPAGSADSRPPVLALVTNFPEPGPSPSLLGLDQVEMLFHEYGHVLDFALGAEPFALLRFEAWVPMDWVEGPSGFLGRWGVQPAVLARLGRHHETGAPIPGELIDALDRLESLNAAMRALRHLSMGLLDVLLHGEAARSVDEADRESWRMRGIARPEGTCFPATFPHLLGGYDGAVHGFVWAQVLRDDLLSRFERDGMLSPGTGADYRNAILEPSWARDPLIGMTAFLGRPWSVDAFMRRMGGT